MEALAHRWVISTRQSRSRNSASSISNCRRRPNASGTQSAPHAAKGIEQRGGAPGLVSGGRVVRERDREFESFSLQRRVRALQPSRPSTGPARDLLPLGGDVDQASATKRRANNETTKTEPNLARNREFESSSLQR